MALLARPKVTSHLPITVNGLSEGFRRAKTDPNSAFPHNGYRQLAVNNRFRAAFQEPGDY